MQSISVFLGIANFADFWREKCWSQHISKGMSRDLYIFYIFFRSGLTVPTFIIARYLRQIWGRGPLWPHHPWAAPKATILNKVQQYSLNWLCALIMLYILLEWIYTLLLPEFLGTPCSEQVRYPKFKWLQQDLNPQPLSP